MANLLAPPPPGTARPPARRRRLLTLALLVVGLALVGETIWFAPFAGEALPPARAAAPLPLADVNPYGANVFLEKEVDLWKKKNTLSLMHTAGLGWVKQEFPWSEIEFQKGVFWDDRNAKSSWTKFDEIVDLAAQQGFEIIARLDRPPAWARAGGTNPEAPPAKLSDFGDFVAAFVAHYKGRIQFIQVWNEPNLDAEWNVTDNAPVDPAGYVALLKEAAGRARAVDPDVMILAAPLATTLDKPPASLNMDELDYLNGMYKAGAKDWFDIMAANAYGLDHPPEDPPNANVLNFRRVELLRQVMERNGDGGKAIWFNEYGWNAPDPALVPPIGSTNPKPSAQRPWGSVTREQQAAYTVGGIQWARDHWPWAGVFTIWYFRQVGDIAPTSPEYYFQMVNPDWVEQPVYNRVQAAAAALTVAGPGTYNELAPPVAAPPGWMIHHDPQANGGLTLLSTVASDTIRLSFQGTDLSLTLGPPAGAAAVAGATSPRLFITVDGSTAEVAAALPRDAAGRPYLDGRAAATLQQPGSNGAVVSAAGLDDAAARLVPVVSNLHPERPSGVHTVELTPDGPGVTFDGFVVHSERAYWPFALTTSLLLVVLVALIVALRRTRRRGPA